VVLPHYFTKNRFRLQGARLAAAEMANNLSVSLVNLPFQLLRR